MGFLGVIFFSVVFTAGYMLIAALSGNFPAVLYGVSGGTLLVIGFVMAYNTNSDRTPGQHKLKLEDDIAFMSALYHRVHPDYQDDIHRDIQLIDDLAYSLGYDLNEGRIDRLFKEYLKTNIDWFARNAEAKYTQLE